jgi:putative transposase
MPRPLRTDHEGAWHHVFNRGVARTGIFPNPGDRDMFLEILAEGTQRAGVEIHAYCLMTNHYYLLLRSNDGRLADAMKWFSGRFTQRINYRERRDGPLFRGRYMDVPIDTDAHLLQASRYVLRNPVAAGLASQPEAWPWSSAAAMLGMSSAPKWLVTGEILSMFGKRDPQGQFREFLKLDVDEATREFYAKLF